MHNYPFTRCAVLAAASIGLLMTTLVGPDVQARERASREQTITGTTILHRANFAMGADGWHTYTNENPYNPAFGCIQKIIHGDIPGNIGCLVPLRWGGGVTTSSSPWWVDDNHKSPGAGYLQIVGALWLDSYFGGIGVPQLNLSDAVITMTIQVKLKLNGARLYYWFQTVDPAGFFANYYLEATPIDALTGTDGRWKTVELQLPSDPDKWGCLGSNEQLTTRYGCGDVLAALQNVRLDMGLILLPVDPANVVQGHVSLRRFVIERLNPVSGPGE